MAVAHIQRQVQHVAGVPTEIFSLISDRVKPVIQLVVIPGNPGNAGYYKQFMQDLDQVFQGAAKVVAVSHMGHAAVPGTEGKVWTLEEQIDHKVSLLQSQLLQSEGVPTVLLGHSIGTYIALHAVQRFEKLPCSANTPGVHMGKVIGLCPFLQFDPTCKRQRFLRWVAGRAGSAGWLAGGLGKLPSSVKTGIISLYSSDLGPAACELTASLLTRNTVHNNLFMAQHEFIDLDRPMNMEQLTEFGPRLALLCAPQDMWFPLSHFEAVRSHAPTVQAYWEEQLTHAFCTSSSQCRYVAERVLHLTSGLFPSAAEGGPAVSTGAGRLHLDPINPSRPYPANAKL